MEYKTMMQSGEIFMKDNPDGEIGICDCGCGTMYGPQNSDSFTKDDIAKLVAMGWVYEESGRYGSTTMYWMYPGD